MECSSYNLTDIDFIGLQFTDSNNKISTVPKEIVQHIFSFLSEGDLIRSAKVCRLWNRLSNLETIWKPTEQNILDDFQSLVIQGVLSWKDAKICSRFSDFIKLIFDGFPPAIDDAEYNFGKNITNTKRMILTRRLKDNGFIKYGNYYFSVISTKQVRIDKKGETFIYELEVNKRIAAIQVEDTYLFILREDGIIVQWNYKTKTKVQEIETAIIKKRKELLESLIINYSCFPERGSLVINYSYFPERGRFFYVKNNLIHIKYQTNALEVISFTKKKFSHFFTDEKLFCKSFQHCTYLQQINFNSDVYLVGGTSIWKGNLNTNQTAFVDLSDFIGDWASIICMTINNNYFFGFSQQTCNFDVISSLVITNLENKKSIKFSLELLTFSIYLVSKITVFHNLLFCFGRDDKSNKIVVFDINTQELLHEIPCNFNISHESEIIKELVTITKKHSKPLVLPVDLTTNDPSDAPLADNAAPRQVPSNEPLKAPLAVTNDLANRQVATLSQIKKNRWKIAGFTLLAITAIAIAAIASLAALQFFLTGNIPFAGVSGAIVLGSIATLGFCIAMIVKLAKENKRMQV